LLLKFSLAFQALNFALQLVLLGGEALFLLLKSLHLCFELGAGGLQLLQPHLVIVNRGSAREVELYCFLQFFSDLFDLFLQSQKVHDVLLSLLEELLVLNLLLLQLVFHRGSLRGSLLQFRALPLLLGDKFALLLVLLLERLPNSRRGFVLQPLAFRGLQQHFLAQILLRLSQIRDESRQLRVLTH